MAYNSENYIKEGGLPLWNIWLTLKRLEDYKKRNILHLLIPSPHKKFDIEKVENFMKSIEREWELERDRRVSKSSVFVRAFPFTELPLNAKLWAYEVIKYYRAEMEKERNKESSEIEGEIANYYGRGT